MLHGDNGATIKSTTVIAMLHWLCAGGFNLRWLLRALARVGLLALLALINMVVAVAELLRPNSIAVDHIISNRAAG